MLKTPQHELGLEAGDIGTVVLVHEDGRGFEVGFVNTNGDSLGVITLTRDAVDPAG